MHRILVALVAAVALMLVVPDTQAQAKNTVHRSTYWSWTGPSSWTASYGAYGITVFGTKGAVLDFGFSTTMCASGAKWDDSVRNYFAAKRAQLKSNGMKFDKVKAVTHPSGTPSTFRRQKINFHTTKGTKKKGTVTLDYDFTSNVDGVAYCYQASLARYSKKSAWSSKGPVLTRIQKSLAYFGPGACESTDAC